MVLDFHDSRLPLIWGCRSWSRMQMKRPRKNRLDYRNSSTDTFIWDPRRSQCLISLWRVKDHLTIHLSYRCLTAGPLCAFVLYIVCIVSTLQDNLGRMLRESGNFEGAEFYFKDCPLRLGHKSGSLVFLWGHIEIAGAHSQVNFWKSLRKAHLPQSTPVYPIYPNLPHYKLQDLLEEIERMYGKDHAGTSLDTTVNCGLMQLESSNQICTAMHCMA